MIRNEIIATSILRANFFFCVTIFIIYASNKNSFIYYYGLACPYKEYESYFIFERRSIGVPSFMKLPEGKCFVASSPKNAKEFYSGYCMMRGYAIVIGIKID